MKDEEYKVYRIKLQNAIKEVDDSQTIEDFKVAIKKLNKINREFTNYVNKVKGERKIL